MRIALLVNRDIHSLLALNLLLPELGARAVAVFISEKIGGAGLPAPTLLQLKLIEQDIFNTLVAPIAERHDAPGRLLTFEQLAARHEVPILSVGGLKASAFVAALDAVAADLFISIRFARILKDDALALPKLGVLNLHSGLLPDFRGLLPTFRALHSGATTIGCTLHWIDQATIDTGPIIATAQRPVDRNESLFSHIHSLYPLGVPKILDAVARLEGGEQLPAQPQDPASGGYFTFPEESELRDFLAAGWRLFDRAEVLELVAAFAAKQTPR